MSVDEKWMQHALALAKRGTGFVHPNPLVGAVVVKNGKVIGEGYHDRFGNPHAEVYALKQSGKKAQGATLYVTLEPCSHWGKTPPCVNAVIASGIREVVVAMKDPNPRVSGRGFKALQKKRIRVRVGILEAEAQMLNRAFTTSVTEKRPYVTLKAATSLDGKIATISGESHWITGEEARAKGHEYRAEADAIAVGIGTVLKDNPSLASHGQGRNPVRVIFDRQLRTPRNAKIFSSDASTLIFCSSNVSEQKRQKMSRQNVEIVPLSSDVHAVTQELHRRGLIHLLVEGGGTLAASFVEADLVDEIIWFIAPKIIGGKDAKTAIEGQGIKRLANALRVQDWQVERIGRDLFLRGVVNH